MHLLQAAQRGRDVRLVQLQFRWGYRSTGEGLNRHGEICVMQSFYKESRGVGESLESYRKLHLVE